MKKLLFILLFLPCFSFGQNLVPNPSFEDTIACPDSLHQVYNAVSWSSYRESPDYFNACAHDSTMASVPNNNTGYQFAATGNAYCGFSTYIEVGNDYREFIGAQLTTPMTIGQKYYIRYKLNLIDSAMCGTNKVGVLFSTIAYSESNPALINNSPSFYSNLIITDSINWTLITGSFIADSAYQYLCIGNFFNDANTDTILSGVPMTWCVTYYYIDDVCVSPDSLTCMGEVGLQEATANDEISIYPNPTKGKFTVQGATAEIQVYDLFGRLLLSTNKSQIDMSGFAKGLYVWKIGSERGKLVLE